MSLLLEWSPLPTPPTVCTQRCSPRDHSASRMVPLRCSRQLPISLINQEMPAYMPPWAYQVRLHAAVDPPWSNLYHLLALISTTFLHRPHTPPWCFCPKPSLLPHQGLRTCCFLGLEFSFSQISSKRISSLPASVCSDRTLSWRPRWPPYVRSSSRLLPIPFLLLSSLLQMSSLECVCLLMSRLLPLVYTVGALADEIESLREINLPTV